MIFRRMGFIKTIKAILFGIIAGFGIGVPAGKILYWNFDQSIATIKAHNGSARTVVFSPDSKSIASSGSTFIRIWSLDLKRKQPLKLQTEFRPNNDPTDFFGVQQMGYSKSGQELLSSNDVEATWHSKPDLTKIRTWNISDGTRLTTTETTFRSVRFSNSSGDFVSSDGKYMVSNIMEEESEKPFPLMTLLLHSPDGASRKLGKVDIPVALALTKEARSLAVGDWSGKIQIWNLSAETPPRSFLGQPRYITWPYILDLLKRRTGNPFKPYDIKITSLLFTPDDKHLLAAGSDGSVLIMNPTTGKFIDKLTGHTHGITSMSLSPDGKTLVTASHDKTLKLWDLKHLY